MKDESAKINKSILAENSFVNSKLDFEPYAVDSATLLRFFERAEAIYSPFDTEDEPGMGFKRAVEKLSEGLCKQFRLYSQSIDI